MLKEYRKRLGDIVSLAVEGVKGADIGGAGHTEHRSAHHRHQGLVKVDNIEFFFIEHVGYGGRQHGGDSDAGDGAAYRNGSGPADMDESVPQGGNRA